MGWSDGIRVLNRLGCAAGLALGRSTRISAPGPHPCVPALRLVAGPQLVGYLPTSSNLLEYDVSVGRARRSRDPHAWMAAANAGRPAQPGEEGGGRGGPDRRWSGDLCR